MIQGVKGDNPLKLIEILGFSEAFERGIINKDSFHSDVSKNVGDVLITKCVVDGNGDDFVKDTSEINDTPFESVFSKDSDKIQVIV